MSRMFFVVALLVAACVALAPVSAFAQCGSPQRQQVQSDTQLSNLFVQQQLAQAQLQALQAPAPAAASASSSASTSAALPPVVVEAAPAQAAVAQGSVIAVQPQLAAPQLYAYVVPQAQVGVQLSTVPVAAATTVGCQSGQCGQRTGFLAGLRRGRSVSRSSSRSVSRT